MDIEKIILEEVKTDCNKYKESSEDSYDYFEMHIKYVYREAKRLALKYNADMEIVSLGALLHDIALILKVGDRKDHHINGKILANEILTKYNYPDDKKERVLSTVFNHRSSKNATNIEDICVADADVLAHFDNIPMLFSSAYVKNKVSLNDIREYMIKLMEKDFDDLSDKTKEEFRNRYESIIDILFVE